MSHFKGPDVLTALTDFRPETSALHLLVEKLREHGDAISMIEGETGQTATYKDLLKNVTSISAGLRSKGVTAGDYVVFCCDKTILSYSALLGAMLTGATLILYPIPHINVLPKLTMGVKIKAVFCAPHYLTLLEAPLSQLSPPPSLVFTVSPDDPLFTSLLQSPGPLEVYPVKDVNKHIPFIFFSSGTTGDPKGILTKDLYIQHCFHCFAFGSTKFLHSAPMFWMSALMTCLSGIYKKFTVVWSNISEPSFNLQLIDKYKIDGWFTGTGTMTRYINEPALSKYDLTSVNAVLVGGEYVVKSIFDGFVHKVLGGRSITINGYGSTEGGLLALMNPGKNKFQLGNSGKLYPGCEMKVVDDRNNVVPVGTLGEVWIKPITLTPGYWCRENLNREVFDKDGFLRIGDAGFFDDEGHIHLRGRVGDLITFRGIKVSPAEVDDVLMSHPDVLDAAAVGKPHPTDNQHMTAYVVKVPGAQVTEKELADFVNGKVEDKYKLRGGVHFLDALPRTIIGKVQRNVLREM